MLLLLACIVYMLHYCRPTLKNKDETTKTVVVYKTDTIHIIDTVIEYRPQPYIISVIDTLVLRDTVMLREQKTYKDSLYMAWVSGYSPNLDSIIIYPRTTIINNDIIREVFVPPKRKPFGLGVQFGYGYPQGVYVGLGVSYNIINF